MTSGASPVLPSGVITLMFTDIEDATAHLLALGDGMVEVLSDVASLTRATVEPRGGVVVKAHEDGSVIAFTEPTDAVGAAIDLQRALGARTWTGDRAVTVRIGIHHGEVVTVGRDYLGVSMAVCARLCAAAHGGQTLLSEPAVTATGAAPDGARYIDLGEHALKGFPKALRLYELRHPDLPSGFPPPRTASVTDHNLPVPPTPMVGRENLLNRIAASLAGGTRMITLTGLGGIGKTRAALEVGYRHLAYAPGGVWFVDLAAIAAPGLVERAIARPLEITESPGSGLRRQIVERLDAAPTLLIADNCEQVPDAASVLAELVSSTTNLTVLATSRERLNVPDEEVITLEPLSMPGDQQEVAGSEAVVLFAQRAAAADHRFALDEGSTAGVVAVVERCHGIPLAIELAAAQIRSFAVGELAAALGAAIDLLGEGDRDLPPRQQSLRATIAWTYDTLDERSARAFRALATFAGGAPLDAVDPVCGAGTSDVIEGLAEKSLVSVRDGRVGILEPLRLYAIERQREAGEADDLAQAHAAWVEALVTRAAAGMPGPQQPRWLDVLEREHDNARAALASGVVDLRTRSRIAVGMERFWNLRGYWSEGRAWLDSLELEPPDPVGLIASAALARRMGAGDEAQRLLERARALARTNPALLGRIAGEAGALALQQGRPKDAVPAMQEAVRLLEASGDRRLALAGSSLGSALAGAGRIEEAEEILHSGLARAEQDGDEYLTAVISQHLGHIASIHGDLAASARHMQRALAGYRAAGDRRAWWALKDIAMLAFRSGEVEQARAGLEEVLHEARSRRDLALLARAHLDLAAIEAAADTSASVAHLDQVADVAERLGDQRLVVFALASKAQVMVATDEAGARAAAAAAIERAGEDSDALARGLAEWGKGLAGAGHVDEAHEVLGRARRLADEAGLEDLASKLDRFMGDLPLDGQRDGPAAQ